MRIRTWPVIGCGLTALWVFIRGVELAVDAVLGELLIGVVVGMPVAYLFRRFYPGRVDPLRGLLVVPYVVLYVLVFAREMVVANFDVAYRVLAPGDTLEPEVIYIPLRVRTDLAVTTIANSVTITPGTITLDHDEERNAIYVHVIDGRDVPDIVRPIRKWEDIALRIFDEELGPHASSSDVIVTGGDRSGD